MFCSAAIQSPLSWVETHIFLVFALCTFVQSFVQTSEFIGMGDGIVRQTAQTLRSLAVTEVTHTLCTLFRSPGCWSSPDGLAESR